MLEWGQEAAQLLGGLVFILPTHGHQRALAPLSTAVGLLSHGPQSPSGLLEKGLSFQDQPRSKAFNERCL